MVSGIAFMTFLRSISFGNGMMFPSASSDFAAQNMNSPLSQSSSNISDTSVGSTSRYCACSSMNYSYTNSSSACLPILMTLTVSLSVRAFFSRLIAIPRIT